jgi:hypothetical protein
VAQEARAKKEEEEKRVKEGWRLVERKREGRRRFDEYVTSWPSLLVSTYYTVKLYELTDIEGSSDKPSLASPPCPQPRLAV